MQTLNRFAKLEQFLFSQIDGQESGANRYVEITPLMERERLLEKFGKRIELCRFILDYLYTKASAPAESDTQAEQALVQFSLYGLYQAYCSQPKFQMFGTETTLTDIEDALLYPAPSEITLQLTHKDVVLDFFKDKKAQILRLRSGNPLELAQRYLTAQLDGKRFRAAKLSKACSAKLSEWQGKGYSPVSADVRVAFGQAASGLIKRQRTGFMPGALEQLCSQPLPQDPHLFVQGLGRNVRLLRGFGNASAFQVC